MTVKDITEDIPYDLTSVTETRTFELTDTAYDLSIDNMAFMMTVSNQNPYRRETAQYRKDQFDNSPEPGEQSLTGWWLRSQTSFHNGAGIKYYEPGTDFANVAHRFEDSRGVDVWTTGEAKLLNEVFHNATTANAIVATAGGNGTNEYIISGDSGGTLKRIQLNGDSAATVTTCTLDANHVPASNPFKAITSDGTRYYAVCNVAIHVGNIDGSDIATGVKDIVIARHATGGVHSINYTKGYLMFGEAYKLYYIPLSNPLVSTGHSTSGDSFPSGTLSRNHQNPNFIWNTIEGGNKFIYAGGYAGVDSEIWAIPFDANTLTPNPEDAVQVVQLPYGEIVQSMHFYLGYLAIGTTKGVRISRVNDDGSVILGPLLYDSNYPVTGFTANGNYIYASTTLDEGTITNGCLVRIDLSSPFEDGAFPYAYDLQYQSDEDSTGEGVIFANDRLHLVVNEGTSKGEIQTEMLNTKRSTGWLRTGKIRYGMIEPKYFKYINATVSTGIGDSINISVINQNGQTISLNDITVGLSNQDIAIENLSTKQEQVAFKFTFNNVTGTGEPVLYGYQVKATPATRRQRLYQYPLSCFDVERDKFDMEFGYSGRAIKLIQELEAIEQTGRFVNVVDYRTNETYEGIIEEVRFTNESSPDRDQSGFGGLLLVTVRKL